MGISQENRMNLEQFIIFMHLINTRKKSMKVPISLSSQILEKFSMTRSISVTNSVNNIVTEPLVNNDDQDYLQDYQDTLKKKKSLEKILDQKLITLDELEQSSTKTINVKVNFNFK